ncbi:acyl-CoA dehydrogenase [Hortaea werneckii]|nr:acyl-CoA dehydrogenase [Hortaea werneckii]
MPSSTEQQSFGSLSPWSEPAWCHGIPSPYYNDSHKKLRDAIRAYVDERILPYSLDWEAKGEAPREEAMRWAQSGFAFADVPPEYRPKNLPGPAGIPVDKLDVFHLLVSTDETSRVEGGVTSSLSGASVIGIPPVIHHGTEQQKRQWLPGLFDWTTSFCLGITEPTGGSDVANIQTTAVKSGDGGHYIVNGYKKWITGAPWATHMTTAVRTGGAGMGGLSVLVIPTNSPGLTWRRIPNSGQNAGGASLVELDDVQVPVENRVGKEGDGFRIIMVNFNRERYIMAVGSNRKARTCLNIAFDYANKRETFGKPLISNQIIAAKFATLARYIESHWAWLESIAYAVQQSPRGWQDPDIAGRIALAKVQAGRIQEMAIREAQQVLGGAGYQRGGPGAPVEQQSRDLRMMVVGGGSEEIISDLAFAGAYAASSGDSYTDVGFNITTGPYPNPSNYEGNPDPPGKSSAYALNWAQDISAEYNKSLIYLYDFAHSGAIVNSSLISPYQSVNNTFTAQADNQFLAYLTGEDRIVNWHSSDSLFTVFFGINDIDRALGGDYPFLTDWDERLPLIQDSYWAHVEKLYNAGARNFAFLNLPTYWLSPGIINRGNATVVDVARHRNLLWNHELAKRFEHFQCTHRSTFAKLVDVYGLWESMYAYPAAYGLSNVTEYCDAYYGGTGTDLTAYNSSCSAPVNEYLWINWLHPTWTVHRYLAKLVLEAIGYLPARHT